MEQSASPPSSHPAFLAPPQVCPSQSRMHSSRRLWSRRNKTSQFSTREESPLTDAKGNVLWDSKAPTKADEAATNGSSEEGRELSTNVGLQPVNSARTTPHRAGRSRQFLCGTSYCKTRMKSSRSPLQLRCVSPMGKTYNRRMASPKSCCFISPAQAQQQYGIMTDRRKAVMKEYYRKRKEIAKKYEEMIKTLKEEETAETRCAVLKSKPGKNIEAAMEDIKREYARTENLLLQQKVMEEEELLKSYKGAM